MESIISSALKDWIPYQLQEEAGNSVCRWLHLGEEHFDEPFFDETILKCRRLPQNARRQRCVSDLAILPEWAPYMKAISPTAIIFHVSRCGSTLLSQLLARHPAHIVLSEVPFLDELLRRGFRKKQMEEAGLLFKAALCFYGAIRKEEQQRLFIKTDSWHLHFYKELRSLFPGIPFILLYRRPDEIIRSQQKRRGMQSVPGMIEPGIFGLDEKVREQTNLDLYMTSVLETYFTAMLDILQRDELAVACNYSEGMMNILQKVLSACRISVSEEELEQLKERTIYHGKYPEQVFAEDPISEKPADFLEKVCALYDAVEERRLGLKDPLQESFGSRLRPGFGGQAWSLIP